MRAHACDPHALRRRRIHQRPVLTTAFLHIATARFPEGSCRRTAYLNCSRRTAFHSQSKSGTTRCEPTARTVVRTHPCEPRRSIIRVPGARLTNIGFCITRLRAELHVPLTGQPQR